MTAAKLPEQELARLLRQLAEAEVPGLMERARSRALARAEQLIEEALVEELLAAAAGTQSAWTGPAPEPEPSGQSAPSPETKASGKPQPSAVPQQSAAGSSDGSEAWWTYCVLWRQDAEGPPPDLEGVEPGSRVEVVYDGDLAALASPVPLPEYGDERLRVHLEDLDWVERVARRHEDVLDAALDAATIVPLRLCTLYRSRGGVHQLLEDHGIALREGLGQVEGCVEWGVKVFAAPHADNGYVVADAGEAVGGGFAYLKRRQEERVLAERASEVRARCVEVLQQRIESLSRASTTNPPQRPEVHGRDEAMLLNGAYLVERNRRAELHRALETLQEEWCPLGFTIELTGPWPPYNFVTGAAGMLS
ncbi:MAG: GvpL/GvpF family gas vesicle protein [Solirubrobacterales bacterium]|nr:GvpL/GvpF family gas vesicle protein [Solirubrobacterales bacterium]